MFHWSFDFLNFVSVEWHGLRVESKAAIVSACATLFAAFAGFGAIILQMRSQGRSARATIIETERRKLKAGLYEEAVLVCREVTDTAIALTTNLRILKINLEDASLNQDNNIPVYPPSTRMPDLFDLHTKFSTAATRIVFLIETRQIINPDIIVFRTAFSAVLFETGDMIFSRFPKDVAPSLYTNRSSAYIAPSSDKTKELGIIIDQLIEHVNDAIAYTEDFLLEMQNLLLGDLFGTRLKHRQPLDSSKVIRLDRAKELETWFRTETRWGKNISSVEGESRIRLASR